MQKLAPRFARPLTATLAAVVVTAVSAVTVVGAAGCPKKTGAAGADGGVPNPERDNIVRTKKGVPNPHEGLSHEELLSKPQGIHDAVSKSKIATLPMSAPVVTVDDVTFTRGDLERAIAQHAVVAGIPPDQVDAPTRDALEQPAYDKMIERKLLGDEAKRRNLWPTDDEVKKEREKLIATLPPGKTIDDALKAMQSDDKQFQQDVAQDVAIGKLFDALKKETPPPDDKTLHKFYDDNKAQFVVPDTASAMHILVKVDKDAKPEDVQKALEKAKAIRAEVAGKDEATFKKVATEKSDDPSAKMNGGDLGTFAKGDMVKQFEEAAFKLKPGEISEPVRSDFGFHIIRGGGQKKGGQKSYDEMKGMISDRLGVKQFMDKVDNLIDSLRAKAKITRIEEPLPSPFSQDDGKGTRVPAWKPDATNAKPGSSNPHVAPPPGTQPG